MATYEQAKEGLLNAFPGTGRRSVYKVWGYQSSNFENDLFWRAFHELEDEGKLKVYRNHSRSTIQVTRSPK